MSHCKSIFKKISLFALFFLLLASVKINAQDGKALFQGKCASCHNVFKKLVGPALAGFQDRHTWSDIKELTKWVNNPAAYMAKDPYTTGLKNEYGSMMTGFADLKEADVAAIATYINKTFEAGDGPKTPVGGGGTVTEQPSGNNAIIFGVISLILAIIGLILMQVNSNLKKLSDDREGILRPDPVPFWKNKIYIALLTILFFIVGGFYVVKGAIGMGREKDYQPEQPIYYSHKVHAGVNQINCLYCHGNAQESKLAAIPSTSVCMNCHKNINEYKGEPLVNSKGEAVDGTAELKKLFKYAGFDPENANAWDASKAKSIPWVKIHNLPDHVYFNHSQHVVAGKVQCQTCHGEITAMNEVKQFSELSMGWCINCHRQTKVDFDKSDGTGNKFYSIYEKFHNDLRPDTIWTDRFKTEIKEIRKPKMDSVTVKDIGGIECQKCHY